MTRRRPDSCRRRNRCLAGLSAIHGPCVSHAPLPGKTRSLVLCSQLYPEWAVVGDTPWRKLNYRLTDAGLARITAPALILCGGADTWLPASRADGLAARIPNAAATVLPNCGHTVHEDCPAQTNPLMTAFLR
ncbi:alpha/beta fold hydrolase [Nocardia gipuzkoensis]